MRGAHDPEVAGVDRGDPAHVEPFGDCDEAGVGPAESQVPITVNELADTVPVSSYERLNYEPTLDNRRVQRDLTVGPDLTIDEVRGLGNDQSGRHERSIVILEQRAAYSVIGVAAVGGGNQHAGVDDEDAQERPNPSASSSSASRAVRPDVDAPIPANAR